MILLTLAELVRRGHVRLSIVLDGRSIQRQEPGKLQVSVLDHPGSPRVRYLLVLRAASGHDVPGVPDFCHV